MGTRFARWMELAAADRWRLLGLMAALPAVSASLRLFGVVRTRRWLERVSAKVTPRAADSAELRAAETLAQLTAIAGRRGAISATCLRQSLLVYCLLRRRGQSPELMLGVRKVDSAFDAHAWVRLQGMDLGQADLVHIPFANRDWSLAGSR